MKGLPVWFGPLSATGCPVENVVIAVTVQPASTIAAQLRERLPRPKGNSHTALATARCVTSKFVGPLEHSPAIRHLVAAAVGGLPRVGQRFGERVIERADSILGRSGARYFAMKAWIDELPAPSCVQHQTVARPRPRRRIAEQVSRRAALSHIDDVGQPMRRGSQVGELHEIAAPEIVLNGKVPLS